MRYVWIYVYVILTVAILVSAIIFIRLGDSENGPNIELVSYKVINDYTVVSEDHWNDTSLRLKFNVSPHKITDEYNVYVYNYDKKMIGRDLSYGVGQEYLDVNLNEPINFVGTYYVGIGGGLDPNLGYYPFHELVNVFKINFEQPSLEITGWSLNYKKETNDALLDSIEMSFRVNGETPFYYKYILWEINGKSNGIYVGSEHIKEVDPNRLMVTTVYVHQNFPYGTYDAKITFLGCDQQNLTYTIPINLEK